MTQTSDDPVFLPHHYGMPIFLCESQTEDQCWIDFKKMMGESKESLINQNYSAKELQNDQ